MRNKKDLGNFLSKKKSWRKILGYLEKYLNKYGKWNYTYEFDAGSVQIVIKPLSGDKPIKASNIAAEGVQGFRQPIVSSRGRRLRRLKRKAKLEKK